MFAYRDYLKKYTVNQITALNKPEATAKGAKKRIESIKQCILDNPDEIRQKKPNILREVILKESELDAVELRDVIRVLLKAKIPVDMCVPHTERDFEHINRMRNPLGFILSDMQIVYQTGKKTHDSITFLKEIYNHHARYSASPSKKLIILRNFLYETAYNLQHTEKLAVDLKEHQKHLASIYRMSHLNHVELPIPVALYNLYKYINKVEALLNSLHNPKKYKHRKVPSTPLHMLSFGHIEFEERTKQVTLFHIRKNMATRYILQDMKMESLYSFACQYIDLFVQKGYSVTDKDAKGLEPLQLTIKNLKYDAYSQMVYAMALIKKGADPETEYVSKEQVDGFYKWKLADRIAYALVRHFMIPVSIRNHHLDSCSKHETAIKRSLSILENLIARGVNICKDNSAAAKYIATLSTHKKVPKVYQDRFKMIKCKTDSKFFSLTGQAMALFGWRDLPPYVAVEILEKNYPCKTDEEHLKLTEHIIGIHKSMSRGTNTIISL